MQLKLYNDSKSGFKCPFELRAFSSDTFFLFSILDVHGVAIDAVSPVATLKGSWWEQAADHGSWLHPLVQGTQDLPGKQIWIRVNGLAELIVFVLL